MTSEELQRIRERVEKAMPGPMTCAVEPSGCSVAAWLQSADGKVELASFQGDGTVDDCEFYAHARDDIPKLLAYIDELQLKMARGARV